MPGDARMTVRLDPAARRKVDRLAAREGISLNEALNRLLQRAPDQGERARRRGRYRIKPRKVAFGFDIARARSFAADMIDQQALEKLKGGP